MSSQLKQNATTVFILGLLGLVVCAPLGVFAWVYGNDYLRACRRLNVEPDGLGVAGRILGIVATLLLAFGVVMVLLLICAGGLLQEM